MSRVFGLIVIGLSLAFAGKNGIFWCTKTRHEDSLIQSDRTLNSFEVDYTNVKATWNKKHDDLHFEWSVLDVQAEKIVYESKPRIQRLMRKESVKKFHNILQPGKTYEISLVPENLCEYDVEILDVVIPEAIPPNWKPKIDLSASLKIIFASKPVRILMFGLPGVGKSSFVNTVFTALSGGDHVHVVADAGDAQGTRTYQMEPYPLPGSKAILHDSPGYESQFPEYLLSAILGGIVRPGTDLRNLEDHRNFDLNGQSVEDLIHCAIITVDAQDFEANSGHESYARLVRAIVSFRSVEKLEPIRLIIVFTKVDAWYEKRSDWLKIYEQPRARDLKDLASAKFGVTPKDIFFVKNYAEEMNRDPQLEALALLPIAHAIPHGEAFINQYVKKEKFAKKKTGSTHNIKREDL